MKLWQKGEAIDKAFEKFTIGNDPELDLHLAKYDVIGSKAHVKGLKKVGLLSPDDADLLLKGLDDIANRIEEGKFIIDDGIEDSHSQIELLLTKDLGEVGKKVHSGRSRNDQVLTALKLFTKDHLEQIADQVKELFELLITKSEDNKEKLMPGYTHMQIAMPSSFGLWFGAYAESLLDDLILLKAAHRIADKNPLGSAAGYGSSFPLDRDLITAEMGFAMLNHNVVYAQMTRGRLEKSTAFAINSVASTLAKFAMDVCLYAGQNFNFLTMDQAFTTGSSIMPHKHNPDGFELVRGKCNQLQALPYELNLILGNLPSGYHRDLQVLKEHFVPAIQTIHECLAITTSMTASIQVTPNILKDERYDLLFTVEEVNEAVLSGVPFRDAYQQIAKKIKDGTYQSKKDLNHTHVGSIGNLTNDRIEAAFEKEYEYFVG